MFTRFAPSPTGLLHLGHAYAAEVAFQLAVRRGGTCLLRFEDIDHTRIRPEYYEAAIKDLDWLGIRFEETPWRQLDRLDAYGLTLETLKSLGVVYPCFCTRREIEAELDAMTSAPQGPEGPLYPGTCRGLGAGKIAALRAEGREPAWRIDAAAAAERCGPLTFEDLRFGRVEVDPFLLGDAVLARRDIGTSYHLAVVTDDAAQQISHVTRGEDLLASTHLHRVLQALLGFPEPRYLHHPLVTDSSGRRLAKRDDARALRTYRESGLSPAEIHAMLPPLPVACSE
ncbi:tRNA glutamyl-Q(34) synthetase GluQRS [Haloferula sargassicola]|uniref:Glutamate--tRNA ligase n=1 Tax=Haloferula sargassicola TaxID=490096 RepID=A0ABP9ULH2_9BACT